jgi:hypothetical protein
MVTSSVGVDRYFRVWWREMYHDLVGPFKAIAVNCLNGNLSEMHWICPGFLLFLFGLGLFRFQNISCFLVCEYFANSTTIEMCQPPCVESSD